MQIGNRFRCYPTDAQAQTLVQWIGCQRFIYNAKVQEDRYYRRFKRSALSLVGDPVPIDQQYSRYKDKMLTPWLYDVPSVILRNGATRFAGAYQRFFKGLGGRPSIKKRYGKQSVWLTRELFQFLPVAELDTGASSHYQLLLGSKKSPLGELRFKAHKQYQPPQSIIISVHGGQWFVSFNYDSADVEPSEQDRIEHLRSLSDAELERATLGIDRGVVIPFAVSNRHAFDFSQIQQQRLAKKERYIRRWQRRTARRAKGGANRKKASAAVARAKRYQRHVRHDFAHKTSHQLAASDYQLFVVEELNVKGMTAKAKPKQDSFGHYLNTNRKAKSGLNRSILSSAWSSTVTFLTYKATRRFKLVIAVRAAYSSQTCKHCGYTHKDNRSTQERFICQACGYRDNADFQAAFLDAFG